MLDFSILKKTGLRQSGELDKIFNVTRVRINAYYKHDGVTPIPVRPSSVERFSRALKILSVLVDRGTLPLDKGLSKEERKSLIDKIVVKVSEPKSPE